MKPHEPSDLAPETRADVARRRLEQLTASLLGEADDPDDDTRPTSRQETASRPVARHARPAARRPTLTAGHRRVVAVLAAACGVVLTWWIIAERPRSAEVGEPVALTQASAPAGAAGPRSSATPATTASTPGGEVVVDVAGKVRHPGIVTLPAGSRVHEALERAGGPLRGVDTTSLNLARPLVDGEQLLVGIREATTAPAAAGPGATARGPTGSTAPLSLGTATLEQLDALPGIGPVTAQKILDWRTEHGRFTTVDDLLDVPGIGDKTLAELRDLVTP